MLETNLNHLITAEQHQEAISDNEDVVVCCGRMGSMLIPAYEIMELIRDSCPSVQFS